MPPEIVGVNSNTLSQSIFLTPGRNQIEVIAYNEANLIASEPRRIEINSSAELAENLDATHPRGRRRPVCGRAHRLSELCRERRAGDREGSINLGRGPLRECTADDSLSTKTRRTIILTAYSRRLARWRVQRTYSSSSVGTWQNAGWSLLFHSASTSSSLARSAHRKRHWTAYLAAVSPASRAAVSVALRYLRKWLGHQGRTQRQS